MLTPPRSVVYPLDTVKTRLQALPSSELKAETGANQLPGSGEKRKQPKGLVGKLARSIKRNQMLAMLIRIVRTEGVTGVFKGFSASMINTFSMRECSEKEKATLPLGVRPH